MTSRALQSVVRSFASRSAVRFLIRRGQAELATLDPTTGLTHAWDVELTPTNDGAFEVRTDIADFDSFIARGLAFELTSEAPAAGPDVRALDEEGIPTEDAVQRVRSWVDVAVVNDGVRLTLRDAKVDWREGLGL